MPRPFSSRFIIVTLPVVLMVVPGPSLARSTSTPQLARLTLKQVDQQPREKAGQFADKELKALRKAVEDHPRERTRRFALVRALMRRGLMAEALREARAWRAMDAYNLVVVRLIGDIYADLGRQEEARRAYSAVVELLPQDAMAQRALATVFKQSGKLKSACQRLQAAARLRPEDMRIAFELADTTQRLGKLDQASRLFLSIIQNASTPKKVRYPAKQRLAQIYASQRLSALKQGKEAEAARLAGEIQQLEVKGGAVNAIKIYLSWDTDRTDVDLWITNPAGQKVYFRKKKGKFGGALFDDVTSGYGPESFTSERAVPGTYLVQVNYYGTQRNTFQEARGEVVVILHEGTARERRHVLPYKLFRPKQTVTVARITASEEA